MMKRRTVILLLLIILNIYILTLFDFISLAAVSLFNHKSFDAGIKSLEVKIR